MLTESDIHRLVAAETPKSDSLELKQGLPTKNERGGPGVDRWVSQGDAIGDYARNELLAEVVAFANAHGGTLIVGVVESETHPKRATDTAPVPQCADLAARIQLAARDVIEPQIASLAVYGIALNGSDDGVVVVEVPESRLAPHRLTTTKECYIRRADRRERMSMREIQDLVVFRAASGARLDQEFDKRRAGVRERYANQGLAAFRITAIPTSPVYIDHVIGNDAFAVQLDAVPVRMGGPNPTMVSVPWSGLSVRPILRGKRTEAVRDKVRVVADVLQNGVVELVLEDVQKDDDGAWLIYARWIMGVVCNALQAVSRFRKSAGSPSLEYAIECELWSTGGAVTIALLSDGLGHVQQRGLLFPRLSLPSSDDLPQVADQIYRDLMNFLGIEVAPGGFIPDFTGAA